MNRLVTIFTVLSLLGGLSPALAAPCARAAAAQGVGKKAAPASVKKRSPCCRDRKDARATVTPARDGCCCKTTAARCPCVHGAPAGPRAAEPAVPGAGATPDRAAAVAALAATSLLAPRDPASSRPRVHAAAPPASSVESLRAVRILC